MFDILLYILVALVVLPIFTFCFYKVTNAKKYGFGVYEAAICVFSAAFWPMLIPLMIMFYVFYIVAKLVLYVVKLLTE